VADFLARHGFARVANIDGGIDAWSRDCDPALPRY
jgi:rhodanese-related sulfurtransferase